VRWKIHSDTYLGAKTFHTIRCLLRIAAAQTEEKTYEESRVCGDTDAHFKAKPSQTKMEKEGGGATETERNAIVKVFTPGSYSPSLNVVIYINEQTCAPRIKR